VSLEIKAGANGDGRSCKGVVRAPLLNGQTPGARKSFETLIKAIIKFL